MSGASHQSTSLPEQSTTRALWCLILGDSTPFKVSCHTSTDINDLKKLIRQEGIEANLPVLAKDLVLWKVQPSALIVVKPSHTLADRVREHGEDLSAFATQLDPVDTVSEAFLEQSAQQYLHIIVQVPLADHVISPSPSTMQALETTDIQPHITIETMNRGVFGTQDALERNKIMELREPKPEFLMTFLNKLQQRRWVRPETNTMCLDQVFETFGEYFEEKSMETDDANNEDRWTSFEEFYHLVGAFLNTGWKFSPIIKEDNMLYDFQQLAGVFESIQHAKHGIRTEWPLRLLVHAKSDGKIYRYTPKSDFHLSIHDLPFLIAEVQSEPTERDRYRMLLQAACLVRLGNGLHRDNPFIVTALYIRNSGLVDRYFVFSPNPPAPEVCYIMEKRQLHEPPQCFGIMFEIHNLALVVRNDQSRFKAAGSRIPKLKIEITNNFNDTFTATKRTQQGSNNDETGPTKRSRTNPGNQGGTQHGEHVYNNYEVAKAFAKAGYTLESNDEDDYGLAPLNQLRPTMRHARQSNGAAVVVKLIRAGSDEPSLLQHLGSITSTRNHTIPLLATFNLSVGTFIVLPEATPLELGFKVGHFHGKVADLSQQLVDGVAFLHENGVAHLDIKPGNIIVSRQSHLYIIDFDISVRVNGPDELIDEWLGTPQWMAPEIGDQHGPRRLYSPIRADLWSCGLVLQYLASKYGEGNDMFETLARQLLNKDPHLRPMLSSSSSD